MPPRHFSLSPDWLSSAPLGSVFDALERVGTVRVVGGAVRDALLGTPVGDLDLCTDATPETVARAAADAGLRAHPTGLAHGTLTVVSAGQAFEVTTLREDVATDGRRATVRFTGDFAKDAARRDFTMNALYLDRHGVGTDHVGGYDDCLARRVRFIGEPAERILEDHLRILRFFRFHAAYGRGDPDPEGLAACRAQKGSIAKLAAERVHNELARLTATPAAAAMMAILADERFLAPFLPGSLDVTAFASFLAAERSVGREASFELALAALAGFEAQRFAGFAAALRLSRRAQRRGLAAIEAARCLPLRSSRDARALIYEHGAQAFQDATVIAAAKGAEVDVAAALALAREWPVPRLPVAGNDLLAQGGASGPELGARLKRLEAAWRESDFTLDRDALLALDGEHPTDDP